MWVNERTKRTKRRKSNFRIVQGASATAVEGQTIWLESIYEYINLFTFKPSAMKIRCLSVWRERENGQCDGVNSWALYEWLIVGIYAAYDDGTDAAEAAVESSTKAQEQTLRFDYVFNGWRRWLKHYHQLLLLLLSHIRLWSGCVIIRHSVEAKDSICTIVTRF